MADVTNQQIMDKLDGVDQRLSRVEHTIVTVDQRLSTVEQAMATKGDIMKLEDKLELNHQTEIDYHLQALDGIGKLHQKVDRVREDLKPSAFRASKRHV